MKKILALVIALALCLGCASAFADTVVVSMPTKDLQRWNQDGANMEALLKDAGYDVDLQFASNDVQQQLNQVTNIVFPYLHMKKGAAAVFLLLQQRRVHWIGQW